MLFAVSLRWVLLIQEPDCLNCTGQLDGAGGEVSVPAPGCKPFSLFAITL